MSSVNFGGPLDFGFAPMETSSITTRGTIASRRTQTLLQPLQVRIPYFIVTRLTSYAVTFGYVDMGKGDLPEGGHQQPPQKQKIYTQVGQSNGKTPLHLDKGQALDISVSLSVPAISMTPGDVSATLTISGDTWGAPSAVPLKVTLIGVDEDTPIGEKWIALGRLTFSGAVVANAQPMPDGIGSFQPFANGTIFYSADFGAAWISLPIYTKLNSPSVANGRTTDGQFIRNYLGYPTGDSFGSTELRGQAAYFERGMIVIRSDGRAFAVHGAIYLHYRNLGNIMAGSTSSPVVGLPNSDEEPAPNGRCSHFDSGDIYWQAATGAFEVHGAIRERWIELGGPSSFIGYPTSDEMPVMDGSKQIGRYNTFLGGTRVANNGSFPTGQARIYWSAGTGAWETYGDIKTSWLQAGGPLGTLGFPTSGETDTPKGGRFSSFQNGMVVWHGDGPYKGPFPTGKGLQLQLFSFQNTNHDDFNIQINITDSTRQVNHGRMPASDNYGNGNQQFNPPTILMKTANLTGEYTMDVWMICIHEKMLGSDDEDGTITAHYDIDNLWGMTDPSMHSNASFNVNFKPMPEPQVEPTSPALFRTNLFWPFQNFGTDALSWTEFSETFTDVGEGDLSFSLFPWSWHLWERAFFQLVYRGLAKGGNCFGMCLEAVYAREFRTMFVEPIYSSPDNTYSKDPSDTSFATKPNDAVVVEQINIKHGYQVGADFLDWFLAMEMEGALQDPVVAFRESRDSYTAGDWPIISLSQGPLSQEAHCVVPYEWLVSVGGASPVSATEAQIASQPLSNQSWIIRVANPNCPAGIYADDYPHNQVIIDPLRNSYSFEFDDKTIWTGQQGSGGFMFSIPFSQLNSQPQIGNGWTAVIKGGMILIFSGDGQVRQITEDQGTDELARTYYQYSPVSVALSAQVTEPFQPKLTAPQRQINNDEKTRIPGVMYVPLFHHMQPASGTEVDGVARVAQSAALGTPFEMYYIKRPAPGFTWPLPAVEAKASIPTSAAPGPTLETPTAFVRTASAVEQAPNVGQILSMPVPLSLLSSAPTLTFEIQGLQTGPYEWNLMGARMSVSISSPTAANALDRITISQPGAGTQTITLTPDPAAQSRTFSIALGGWREEHNKSSPRLAIE